MVDNPLSFVYLVEDKEYVQSLKSFEVGDILLDRLYNTSCICTYIDLFTRTIAITDHSYHFLGEDLPMTRFYKLIPFHPRNN